MDIVKSKHMAEFIANPALGVLDASKLTTRNPKNQEVIQVTVNKDPVLLPTGKTR